MSGQINAAATGEAVARIQPMNAFVGRMAAAIPGGNIPLVASTHLGFDVDIVDFRDAHGAPTNAPEDGAVSCDNSAVNVSLSSDFRTLSVRVADPTTLGRAVVSYTGNGGRLNLSITVDMQPGGAVSAFFDLSNIRLVERPAPQMELPLTPADPQASPAAAG